MDKKEIVVNLRQIHNSVIEQLKDRRRSFEYDYTDECTECWGQGLEEGYEHLENLAEDLAGLLKHIDINDTIDSPPIQVSEKQKQLL